MSTLSMRATQKEQDRAENSYRQALNLYTRGYKEHPWFPGEGAQEVNPDLEEHGITLTLNVFPSEWEYLQVKHGGPEAARQKVLDALSSALELNVRSSKDLLRGTV